MKKIIICLIICFGQSLWANYDAFVTKGASSEVGYGSSCNRAMEEAHKIAKDNAQARCAMYEAIQITEFSNKLDCDPKWAKVESEAKFICSTENNITVIRGGLSEFSFDEAIKRARISAVNGCNDIGKGYMASDIGYNWKLFNYSLPNHYYTSVRAVGTFYCYQ